MRSALCHSVPCCTIADLNPYQMHDPSQQLHVSDRPSCCELKDIANDMLRSLALLAWTAIISCTTRVARSK